MQESIKVDRALSCSSVEIESAIGARRQIPDVTLAREPYKSADDDPSRDRVARIDLGRMFEVDLN